MKKNVYNPHIFPQAKMIICIGNNEIRKKISLGIMHEFATLVHPNAILADNIEIGEGTVILCKMLFYRLEQKIGKHAIINANTTIDHDVVIENFVSIYPNSYIGGRLILQKIRLLNLTK